MNNEQFKEWFERSKLAYDDVGDLLGIDGTAVKSYVEDNNGIPEWLQYACAFLDMKPVNLEYLRMKGGHDLVERVVGRNNELLASRRDKNWANVPLKQIYGDLPDDVVAVYWLHGIELQTTEPSNLADDKPVEVVEKPKAKKEKKQKVADPVADVDTPFKSDEEIKATGANVAKDMFVDGNGVAFDPAIHKVTKTGKPHIVGGKWFVKLDKAS